MGPDDAEQRTADPDLEVTGGGDPVCWLQRVCDACGALDDGPPTDVCARCGAPRS